MIPFTQNFQNKKIYRDRKQVNSCLALEECGCSEGLEKGRVGNGYEISLWNTENVVKLHFGHGCTTLNILKPLNSVL